MKKLLVAVVVIVVVGLAGIWGWSYYHERASESAATEYEAWSKQQSVVPVEFVVNVPPETPAEQTLYLSGSTPTLGNWDAAGVPMERRDDGSYQAIVDLMSGVEYEFKVTRGTWGTVERGAGGAEIANHTVVAPATRPAPVKVSVATWVDGGKAVPGRVTLTGEIRVHKKFKSDALANERNLVVYLPPDYEKDKGKRYPVLYMNDGQNVFDESTSFAGVEWRVDEAAQQLITAGKIEPVIVVGIYNTEQRTEEFTPPGLAGAGKKASGDRYAKMVVEEVKPFVDRTYRTRPEREGTGMAGSSMGGVIALYTAQKYPQAFGRVALLTPWLRLEDRTVASDLAGKVEFLKGSRVWVDMGSARGTLYPGKEPVADAREFVKLLESAGMTKGKDYQYLEIEGSEHIEAEWAKRVGDVLVFLYGK